MDFGNTKIIGLTGMSGSGKTSASEIFRKNGFAIINCDELARNITFKKTKCLSEIKGLFSDEVVDEKGELIRARVGKIIFGDEQKKKAYERIVFPYITYSLLLNIKKLSKKNRCIILDAPTLFESGINKLCSSVVCVVTELGTAKARIMERDKLSDEEAAKRLGSQKRATYYIERSTYSIINNVSLERLEADVSKIISKIRGEDEKHTP